MPQQFMINNFSRNDHRCYQYEIPGHIKKNYPKLRQRSSKKNKTFSPWNNEYEIGDDVETANMCFMTLSKSS